MKRDITDAVAELVLRADPDFVSRLEYQAEALSENNCTFPQLGKWIDAHDVKYLLSTLALNDKDFATRFPKMAHVKEVERKQLIDAFGVHFDHCSHCSLKRGYDLEIDNRIKLACEQNDQVLLELLEDNEGGLPEEDGHGGLKARSAHQ
jgi:hypothetical protein